MTVTTMTDSSAPMLPLENGDRLGRAEFERRYRAMPELKKAELVEGRVYVGSPVGRLHRGPHALVIGWLTTYAAQRPDFEVLADTTLRLDDENEPQPDVMLRRESAAGGGSVVDEDGYVAGAPELIVEVASSSSSYDLHEKKRVYARHGVHEYLVWRVRDGALDWFRLAGDDYRPVAPGADGSILSSACPGLRLDVNALLAHDAATVLAVARP